MGVKNGAKTAWIVGADGSIPVSGTVLIGGQPIDVDVLSLPSVAVNNWPAVQQVAGTVNVGNLPATQNVAITGQPIDVDVLTMPSVAVNNWPATQPISGAVSVSNFPGTQPVSVANGSDVAEGNTADAAWSGTGAGSVIAVLKAIWTRLRGGQQTAANSMPVVLSSDCWNGSSIPVRGTYGTGSVGVSGDTLGNPVRVTRDRRSASLLILDQAVASNTWTRYTLGSIGANRGVTRVRVNSNVAGVQSLGISLGDTATFNSIHVLHFRSGCGQDGFDVGWEVDACAGNAGSTMWVWVFSSVACTVHAEVWHNA